MKYVGFLLGSHIQFHFSVHTNFSACGLDVGYGHEKIKAGREILLGMIE